MVTPIYAAFIGILLLFLSIHTIKVRKKFGASLGDSDQIEIKRTIRAHGNLTEYSPLFLILLGSAEYGNLPAWAVHIIGVIFVLGRIMHAYSLLKAEKYDGDKLKDKPIWRIYGMMCTFNCIALVAAIIVVQFIIR